MSPQFSLILLIILLIFIDKILILGSNEYYHTDALMLLVKIIMCRKFRKVFKVDQVYMRPDQAPASSSPRVSYVLWTPNA